MSESDEGTRMRFEPTDRGRPFDQPTILLLHGTGGDINDMFPLGRKLLPHANFLGVQGTVMENGMARYFRRFAEGVFDEEDLRNRAKRLNETVTLATVFHGYNNKRVVAVGYSNGANFAASLMLLYPQALAAAVLFRTMVPLTPETAPDLRGKRILMCEGISDPIVPRENAERLASMFRFAGAEVTLHCTDTGHGLTQEDLDVARAWLERLDV